MRYTQKYLEENNIKQNHSQEELNEILGVVKKISDATGLSGFVKKSAGEFVSQLFKPESESRATATFQGSETGARARRFATELGDAAAEKITGFAKRRREKKSAEALASRITDVEKGAESSDLESRFKERRKKK